MQYSESVQKLSDNAQSLTDGCLPALQAALAGDDAARELYQKSRVLDLASLPAILINQINSELRLKLAKFDVADYISQDVIHDILLTAFGPKLQPTLKQQVVVPKLELPGNIINAFRLPNQFTISQWQERAATLQQRLYPTEFDQESLHARCEQVLFKKFKDVGRRGIVKYSPGAIVRLSFLDPPSFSVNNPSPWGGALRDAFTELFSLALRAQIVTDFIAANNYPIANDLLLNLFNEIRDPWKLLQTRLMKNIDALVDFHRIKEQAVSGLELEQILTRFANSHQPIQAVESYLCSRETRRIARTERQKLDQVVPTGSAIQHTPPPEEIKRRKIDIVARALCSQQHDLSATEARDLARRIVKLRAAESDLAWTLAQIEQGQSAEYLMAQFRRPNSARGETSTQVSPTPEQLKHLRRALGMGLPPKTTYVVEFALTNGVNQPENWLKTNPEYRQRIERQLLSFSQGHFGDSKYIPSAKLFECRLFDGPGVRIYYSRFPKSTIVLVIRIGFKTEQNVDLALAGQIVAQQRDHNRKAQ